MAKLKYDRPINIPLKEDMKVTVPNDEVWRVTARTNVSSGVHEFTTNLYGGGYEFRGAAFEPYTNATLSGIAFKHIDE